MASFLPHGADRVTWPWVTTGQTSGVVILAFLRGVSSDLSSSLPSCLPSPELWKLTGSSIINTLTIPNSTRRWDPWIQPRRRHSQSASQRATVEFQQNRGHDSRYKAGSIQAWPSFLLGHRRRRRGEGKHQNPWCPSWSNIIHGQSSQGINQGMQLPHPRSPTRPPRSDTRISQVDRPRSRNISSRLLQLAAVWHLQVKSQQTTARAEWSCASRAPSSLELQFGALAQTASLAPGPAKDHFQDGTYHIQREILRAAFLST